MEFGKLIETNSVHPLKQYIPIVVTDEGIVIEVKFTHPLKQQVPKLCADEGIVIDSNLVL